MFVVIIILIVVFLIYYIHNFKYNRDYYDYKCFLLTIKDQKERQRRFFSSHNKNIPIEIIYGPDTNKISVAQNYEHLVVPEYYEKALEMHYSPTTIRPDITYFNLGAIGCFMGHMEFYKKCFEQKLKYAVIFEDNVIIKSHELYDQIQNVIDEKGDNFEMCFFHCISRLPDIEEGNLEKVNWISSTKCYLINVDNMRNYVKYFYPIDNHIDQKHEDIIKKGARVYYKDLRNCIIIDRTHNSTIGHREHGRKDFFSRNFPNATPKDVKPGF